MINQAPGKRRLPFILLAAVVAALLAATLYLRMAHRAGAAIDAPPPMAANDATAVDPDAMRKRAVDRHALPLPLRPSDVKRRIQQAAAARARDHDAVIAENARIKTDLVSAYRSEKVDAQWAAPQERTLRGLASTPAIAAADVAPRDLDVQCKRTTCRMTAAFAGDSQADDWVLLYMSSVGSALQNSMVSRTRNADGSVNVEIHSKAR